MLGATGWRDGGGDEDGDIGLIEEVIIDNRSAPLVSEYKFFLQMPRISMGLLTLFSSFTLSRLSSEFVLHEWN